MLQFNICSIDKKPLFDITAPLDDLLPSAKRPKIMMRILVPYKKVKNV
jgi:hypothetical protein